MIGNLFEGFGNYVFENGDKYEGFWKGGKYEGKGTFTYHEDGFKQTGIYEYGEFKQPIDPDNA